MIGDSPAHPNPGHAAAPPQVGDDWDAIVVGAGPAGSMAAWRLATLGHKVVLLERGTHPGTKSGPGGARFHLDTVVGRV